MMTVRHVKTGDKTNIGCRAELIEGFLHLFVRYFFARDVSGT